MKKRTLYMLIMITALLIMGCKNATDEGITDESTTEENDITDTSLLPTQPPIQEIQPSVTVSPEEPDLNHTGEMRSFLTGLWVPEAIGTKRPVAVQFNNFKTVSNQWGIGQADIVYECMVEGGITRLLGIGENFTGDKIGSVRSSRHYFVSIADEYDAIYIHYGKTKYAKTKIDKLDIDTLAGESGIGTTVFYRDKSIKAPHNAFTSLEGITAGIEKKDYRTAYGEGYEPHYHFYETDTDLSGGNGANKVTLHFSGYATPYFEYNTADKLYYRFQYDKKHIDSVTGEQLAFKNIIVQFVKEWDIDKNDYQTMDLEDASGKGIYITNGKAVLITWKKKESERWMRYYNEAGEELMINPGKTYITLFPKDRTDDVKITE